MTTVTTSTARGRHLSMRINKYYRLLEYPQTRRLRRFSSLMTHALGPSPRFLKPRPPLHEPVIETIKSRRLECMLKEDGGWTRDAKRTGEEDAMYSERSASGDRPGFHVPLRGRVVTSANFEGDRRALLAEAAGDFAFSALLRPVLVW